MPQDLNNIWPTLVQVILGNKSLPAKGGFRGGRSIVYGGLKIYDIVIKNVFDIYIYIYIVFAICMLW